MFALLEKLLIQLPKKKVYIYESESRVGQAILEDKTLGLFVLWTCYLMLRGPL